MRIAYFDCISGASGNMILGAMLSAGLDPESLKRELQKLPLDGYSLVHQDVNKKGIASVHVDVQVMQEQAHRDAPHGATLGRIEEIISGSHLPERVKRLSMEIFARLSEAEARVHGTTADRVTLHEAGGIDALVDVVGSVIGLELLGVEDVICSPLPMGRGLVRFSHGIFPNPAPATLELLRGAPVYSLETEAELVTPTGAAILSTLCSSFGGIPSMKISRVGYGAGISDLEHPNVLRIVLGESAPAEPVSAERVALLETNIDDMNPQFYETLIEHLFAAGALDVYLTPVQMKKNRPGTLVSVLAPPAIAGDIARVLMEHSTTLGVRHHELGRFSAARRWLNVETRWGPVRVKASLLRHRLLNLSPEYEDVKAISSTWGVPATEVYHEARALASALAKDLAKGHE